MNDKLSSLDKDPRDATLLRSRASLQGIATPAVFTVKVRVAAPLDHLIAQLYRAWPKPRARKDN